VSKKSVLVLTLLLAGFAPLYYGAYQARKPRRFDIGAHDEHLLGNPETFSTPGAMSGPFRHEDGSVEVIRFQGRLSGRTASIQLPFHARSSPLRLWIRCHRFGLGGTVRMRVNGVHIDDFVFAESSYPWAGIRAIVPQRVAERGALEIDLVTTGGRAPPSHLPPELGLGIDFIDVEPMSEGASLFPTGYEWAVSYLFLVVGAMSLRLAGFTDRLLGVFVGALIVGIALFAALRPVELPTFLSTWWLLFPVLLVLQRGVLLAHAANRRVLFPVMAAGISSLVSLTAAELVLRSYETWQEEHARSTPEKLSLLQPNPKGTGSYRLKPDLDLVTSVAGSEVTVRTNSHGMRWREVSVERAEKQRILFLGDSFTFGSWADSVEKSFVGIFERSLTSDAWEVLNFGVGGYGFADMELLLAEEGIDFEPSYVFLVAFNGNDFRDTYLGIRKDVLVDGTAVLDENNLRARVPERFVDAPHTVSGPSPEASVSRWLRGFALFRFIAPLLRMEHLAVDFAPSSRFVSYSFWSQFPYPEVAARAKDASLESLARIDAFARANGARLVVATLPTREQVYSRRISGEHYDIGLPQAYVQLFARERNIPFLDLLPPLRAHVAQSNENLYVSGDTHLNNNGHHLVGQYLAEWFECCVQ